MFLLTIFFAKPSNKMYLARRIVASLNFVQKMRKQMNKQFSELSKSAFAVRFTNPAELFKTCSEVFRTRHKDMLYVPQLTFQPNI